MVMMTKEGSCNHCGKCCLSKRLGGEMLENPMIRLGKDRCGFYVDKLNDQKYGHCKIYALGLENIEKATDRDGKLITKEQIGWFNQNCIDYPSAEDVEDGYYPPLECSFTFKVVA